MSTLAGRTIALAEGRQLEDLAKMLEKEGASCLRCPMLSILDTPDSESVLAWLKDLIADRFALVILFTGEGVRRLLGFAERAGQREAVIAALARTFTLTRGPKPVLALREVGLKPSLVASSPTTEGVLASLATLDLAGKTLGIQLYTTENAPLTNYLTSKGVSYQTILPYIYAPASDTDQVADLIGKLAQGTVDVLLFTSSPQADRLFEVARERGLESTLKEGLQRTRTAAVGPIIAERLRELGAKVDICPEQGFVMKNLVQHIVRSFAPAS
jgi:uroporphyrinogen-III synthase